MTPREARVSTAMPERVLDLVARQVGSVPERRALVCQGEEIAYAELWRRSNRLAHALRARGVGPGVFVALCTPQGVDALVGLLAILKAGGVILALDSAHPAARLRQILDETEARVLVAHPASLARLRETLGQRLPAPLLTRAHHEAGASAADARPEAREDDLPPLNAPDDTAYMIYTSGSTGAPKGVMIPHRALYWSLVDGTRAILMRAGDRVTQLAPLTFDASVWEHLAPLVCAGEVHCVPPQSVADPEALLAFIEAHGITWTYLPPAYFARWLDSFDAHADPQGVQRRLASLRCIMFAGDTLAPDLVRRWQARMGRRVTLMNFYGPTETTVLVTGHVIDYAMPADVTSVPIGRPFGRNFVRVLDAQARPLQPGEPGFLYIGGPQLASGYYRDPDKTAEAFVEDPLEPGGRLYFSRDRGCLLPNGEIVFLGREDRQVKVRGRRIELDEIEHALLQHPGVRRAAVLALDAGERGALLVAAVETAAATPAPELRRHLRGLIPDYMVPHRLRIVDALPVNANGKIDRPSLRHALAAELARERDAARAAGAPERALTPEQAVDAAWSAFLGAAAASEEGSFLDLGGDSLLLLQVVVALRRSGYTPDSVVGLSDADRSAWVSRLRPLRAVAAAAAAAPVTFPLGPMQEEMFLLAAVWPDSRLYHIQFVFACEALDTDLLAQAARTCMRRHPILRTTFEREGDGWRQRAHARDALPLVEVAQVRLEAEAGAWEPALRRWMEEDHAVPFRFDSLPLFRLAYVTSGDARHLALTFFHPILDGWSFSRLVSELSEVYRELAAGGTPASGEIDAARFDEYVAYLESLRREPIWAEERAYWRDRLRVPLPIPELSTRSSARLTRRALDHTADAGLRAALQRLAARRQVGLHKVLLTAYFQLLHGLSGHERILLGNTVANRPFELPGVDRSLGCFISILPIQVERASAPFERLLPEVGRAFDEALRHSRTPNEALVQELVPEAKRAGLCWRNIFAFDNFPEDHGPDIVTWPPYSWNAIEPFDLALSVIDMHDRLYHYWNYRSDLFDAAQIETVAARYVELLREAVDAAR